VGVQLCCVFAAKLSSAEFIRALTQGHVIFVSEAEMRCAEDSARCWFTQQPKIALFDCIRKASSGFLGALRV
jgi:hypothetical protein